MVLSRRDNFFFKIEMMPAVLISKEKVVQEIEKSDQFWFLGKLPTYPSPKLTLTLTSHLGENDGSGEG